MQLGVWGRIAFSRKLSLTPSGVGTLAMLQPGALRRVGLLQACILPVGLRLARHDGDEKSKGGAGQHDGACDHAAFRGICARSSGYRAPVTVSDIDRDYNARKAAIVVEGPFLLVYR